MFLAIVLVYFMGTIMGIMIGLVLNAIIERWAKRLTEWIFRKFGWDEYLEEKEP